MAVAAVSPSQSRSRSSRSGHTPHPSEHRDSLEAATPHQTAETVPLEAKPRMPAMTDGS